MSYFSHDSNARNDERIIKMRMRHGAAGYGVYFMILERMRDESDYMCAKDYNVVAFDLRVDAALVKSIVEDFGLFVFTQDGKRFYSESFLKRMEKIDEAYNRRAAAGRKGGNAKASNAKAMLAVSDSNATAMPADFGGNKIKEKEKESKINTSSTSTTTACEDSEDDDLADLCNHTAKQEMMCMRFGITPDELKSYVSEFQLDCKCRETSHRDRRDAITHFNDWLRIAINAKKKEENATTTQRRTASKRSGIHAVSASTGGYDGAF